MRNLLVLVLTIILSGCASYSLNSDSQASKSGHEMQKPCGCAGTTQCTTIIKMDEACGKCCTMSDCQCEQITQK